MDDIIKLVKAYLNNETTKFDDDSIVSKAKAQALLPMLYLVTKNNNYKKALRLPFPAIVKKHGRANALP